MCVLSPPPPSLTYPPGSSILQLGWWLSLPKAAEIINFHQKAASQTFLSMVNNHSKLASPYQSSCGVQIFIFKNKLPKWLNMHGKHQKKRGKWFQPTAIGTKNDLWDAVEYTSRFATYASGEEISFLGHERKNGLAKEFFNEPNIKNSDTIYSH